MSYTKNPASGMTNIKISPHNTYAVQVKHVYLGTFKRQEKAIIVRDNFRAKIGMPKLEN